jgi:hypothetical protein
MSATLRFVSRIDRWFQERPRRPPAEIACLLARDRFWRDDQRRLIGTHPDWPDAAELLDLGEELAHAVVLVLSQLPEALRRDFADAFYGGRHGRGTWVPGDGRARLSLAAAVALHVVEIVGRDEIAGERVVDLLHAAEQGDDLTLTPAPALDEVKKVVARVRLDVGFDDPTDPRGAAAHAIAEVLDPSSEVVALQEVLARSAWAAVTSWDRPRVVGFLLDVERRFADA